MQPKAIEIMRARFAGPLDGFPSTRCLPAGIQVADLFATPLKIVQTPRLIVILYEDMVCRGRCSWMGAAFPKIGNRRGWDTPSAGGTGTH